MPYRLLDENFCRGYIGVADKDITYEGVTYHKNEEFPYNFPLWSPTTDDLKIGSMWDYCGFGINVKDLQSIEPTDIPESGDINTPFYLNTNAKGVEPTEYIPRAYNLIYNTMYRDENLIDEVDLDSKALQYRAYRPDYFTKALPFQQLPSDVTFALPFQISTEVAFANNKPFDVKSISVSSGDVQYDVKSSRLFAYSTTQRVLGDQEQGLNTGLSGNGKGAAVIGTSFPGNDVTGGNDARALSIGLNSLEATSQISQALTVAETRNAFQLLKEAERSARTGGHRFDEYIKAHWGEFLAMPDCSYLSLLVVSKFLLFLVRVCRLLSLLNLVHRVIVLELVMQWLVILLIGIMLLSLDL